MVTAYGWTNSCGEVDLSRTYRDGKTLERMASLCARRGMQVGSHIHLGCNCSGTPCQTRLGMVPSVQHVSLELGLEGCTWYTNLGAVNRHTRLGASG